MRLRRVVRAGAMAAASLLVLSVRTESAALSLDPPTTIVQVGNVFTIDLLISDLGAGAAPSVSGFDLVVDYDPTLLLATGVSFGDPILGDQLDLFGLGFPLAFSDVSLAGIVSLSELSFNLPFELDGSQASDFVLASIAFSALATTPGTLLTVDPAAALIIDSLGDPLAVTFGPADVIIEPRAVPEPGTLILLGLGVVGLVRAHRNETRGERRH